MNIKILGTGCAKCHALGKTIKEVVNDLQIDATIEEVEDIGKILEYPVLTTPALVINEEVVSSGQVLKKEAATQLIINALGKEDQKEDS